MKKGLTSMVVAAALAVAPSAAMGAAIVPPGNSAVNQYTQTIPTSGGNTEVRRKGIRSPSNALGKKAANKLKRHGKDGRAAADLAAAGSPTSAGPGGSGLGGGTSSGGGSGSGAGAGSGGGGNASGGAGGSGSAGGSGGSAASGVGPGVAAAAGDGESGLGQVVGEMTGASSSGDLGLWLPLAILATLLWCGAYFWRQRRTAQP
jgi:hypothetical protein